MKNIKITSYNKIIVRVPMWLVLLLSFAEISHAQEKITSSPEKPALKKMDAYRAVHEGNLLLLKGDPATALDYYQRAQELKPDAREIDFIQGLGHYALQEFEESRQAFQRATAGKSDALTNDALYSLGTTYHAEALASKDDPELAISYLESAMRQYQNVLANQPEHEAARDANYKAATYWRNIKKIMEQQQQQQQNQDSNEDQENEENEDQPQQNQDQQENQNQDQQENQQQSDSEKQDQQQKQSENAKENDQKDSKEAQAQQQEKVSKEQAERKLREMMQALRERKKEQRKKKQLIPIRPVDKDW